MNATAIPAEPDTKMLRRNTWRQKLRREFGRLILQGKTLAMRPTALTAQCRFLFILGHMRCGSTLLCHLLCNSDDVIGFGEAHHSYRRRSDLARLLTSVRRHSGKNPLRYRYVLDKIVSSQHVIGTAVLADRRTRYVFLLRGPLPTIASIVAMMRRQYHDETPEQLIAFATQYYTERLAQLEQLPKTIGDPERCLLLTHEQLLHKTRLSFGALEEFLNLGAPLREEYELMPTTGQPGIGDPSPHIRSGKIERTLPRKHVALSADVQGHVEECYATCIEKLRETVPTIGFPSFTKRYAA